MVITALLSLLLGFVLTAAIIAANGYFVAQEFAYMSVDRATLRTGAEKGDASAERALKVTKRTSFMLSGAQLGITVTGLMVGYVAEPFIGESLGELLSSAGVPIAVGISIGTVGALALATVVQMIFGELYPKNLAIASPDPLSRRLARSTLIYLAAFGWLITFFDKSSNAMLRLLRVEPVHDVDSSATAKDLESIIEDSRASGDLTEDLSLLLDRILDFPERDVAHAMIPRTRVDAVTPTTAIGEMRARMVRAHTRYPVIGDREEPIGVVQLAEVMAAAPDDTRPVTEIMRAPLIVPELMPLEDALELLSSTKNELACVIDEYGGFAGVLTIEDLAEELVGEITDEHDDEDIAGVHDQEDGVWLMDGDVHVDEVERTIGRDMLLPRGDYETLAGLLIAEGGNLPEVGDTVRIDLAVFGADLMEDEPPRPSLEVEVLEVDRHVPSELRIRLHENSPDGSEASSESDEDADR
ncbi:hemolysin family protein [Rhodococcus sp. IEGM 1401]|uniref:hemolysin family protein n=1 Tax=unclassified Rhodococcus (in: high G+C Gram-positive bacteria) TaxID=192944 RepID=UPI0022B2F5ED|nr:MULTISPECIES: hemolysin family protein [unclassified Rhodococcus (in: high G+C Gram-positive bacteria)]MCZ4562449.1 hemolysin family protein [Rhodococcus sp. IEGM 1401]MDI9922491.1 hemolysin family protein [Rhodococcus sp. IEGM 1372]MDV8035041.1 hemolysin family protein [Rhodococcus sp. IEGM 1414]